MTEASVSEKSMTSNASSAQPSDAAMSARRAGGAETRYQPKRPASFTTWLFLVDPDIVDDHRHTGNGAAVWTAAKRAWKAAPHRNVQDDHEAVIGRRRPGRGIVDV